jgi:hypothetical protein
MAGVEKRREEYDCQACVAPLILCTQRQFIDRRKFFGQLVVTSFPCGIHHLREFESVLRARHNLQTQNAGRVGRFSKNPCLLRVEVRSGAAERDDKLDVEEVLECVIHGSALRDDTSHESRAVAGFVDHHHEARRLRQLAIVDGARAHVVRQHGQPEDNIGDADGNRTVAEFLVTDVVQPPRGQRVERVQCQCVAAAEVNPLQDCVAEMPVRLNALPTQWLDALPNDDSQDFEEITVIFNDLRVCFFDGFEFCLQGVLLGL